MGDHNGQQLIPIARQASNLNACVEQISRVPEEKPHGRALATRICNGFDQEQGLK